MAFSGKSSQKVVKTPFGAKRKPPADRKDFGGKRFFLVRSRELESLAL